MESSTTEFADAVADDMEEAGVPVEEAEPSEEEGPGEPDPELELGEDGEEEEQHPLTEVQDALREILDFDQLREVRLALRARRDELEKHQKKGGNLGVDEPDARRRIRLLDGDTTRWGLIRLFAPESAFETRDMFYDQPADEDTDGELQDEEGEEAGEEEQEPAASEDGEDEGAGDDDALPLAE